MKAYSFDSNGIYIGEYECQKDPVRSKKDGVDRYFIPANATNVKPPEFDSLTQYAVWDGDSWSLRDIQFPDPNEVLKTNKENKIYQSKNDLYSYLLINPIKWTDGEYYSITQEKQNQLLGTIATAQIDKQPPEWNSTGGVCKEWDINDLSALAVAIKNRVKSLVKYQQEKEIKINNAKTQEELDSIIINYEEVK